MKNITTKTKAAILIVILIIVAFFYSYKNFIPKQNTPNDSQFKVEDNYQSTDNYLKANGCSYDDGFVSNNAYTVCAENALKKIQAEKKQYYDRFQESMKNMTKNALGLDEELNKEFQGWYKNSDDYNHSRCIASMYWTGAGSAYEQNVTICKIFETQRDIQLLDKLYEKKEYFNGDYSN